MTTIQSLPTKSSPKAIVFWGHSYCRSTLQFYAELAKSLGKECIIYTWIESLDLRENVGFSNSEFNNLNIEHIGDNLELAIKKLNEHINDYQIFCSYQNCAVHQQLMDVLISRGLHYGIMSEAPCNMHKYPAHFLKGLYISFVLPHRLHKYIHHADFMFNFAGYYQENLRKIGWRDNQIVSGGYYPPRLQNSTLRQRDSNSWKNFTILLSGLHQWHRSPWLLIKAIKQLKDRGLPLPTCYITQTGPYLDSMKQKAKEYGLDNIHFLGFVSIDRLINLYETCSVYVGSGNYEPWGMRLNDVLACGSPLIVNRGMGGAKIIDEYGCGLTFKRNDVSGLADALEKMITDEEFYIDVAHKAVIAAEAIEPSNAAARYGAELKKFIG